MIFHYIPYIWPLITSACISLSLGVYAMVSRKNAKGAVSFILSMFVVTLWSAANALEATSIDFSTKLFWANIQYFAYCYSPVTLLALCMQFTGYDEWLQNRKVLWLAVIPTIILMFVWTDRLHGLVRYDMHIDYSGIFPVIAKKYGPVFFIHAAYSHFLNIFAGVLLIRTVFFRNTIYRKQAISLLCGMSLIIVPNIMYILGFSPVKRFDVTPVFFGPAGLIIAWGIFRFKMFDLVPLARSTVIEAMDAGVMVLDLQGRVRDINPSFARIIGFTASQVSSRSFEEVCSKIPELVKACRDRSITYTEFSINTEELLKTYEALLTPLNDTKDMLIGRLVVTYEITEKKLAQEAFLKQQKKLAVIEEKQRMARDMHDNLGQVLGFINLQAQGIRQELLNAGVDNVSAKLDKLVNATQAAHFEIREFIHDIRHLPPEKDFISTLKMEIREFEELAGICVDLDMPIGFSDQGIEPNIVRNMLSIIKESLNNISKHAEADRVRISLQRTQEQLCITTEDNGKGFDILNYDEGAKETFGLNIMRERATEIGAQIIINSDLEKGSRITSCVPLKKGQTNEKQIDACG